MSECQPYLCNHTQRSVAGIVCSESTNISTRLWIDRDMTHHRATTTYAAVTYNSCLRVSAVSVRPYCAKRVASCASSQMRTTLTVATGIGLWPPITCVAVTNDSCLHIIRTSSTKLSQKYWDRTQRTYSAPTILLWIDCVPMLLAAKKKKLLDTNQTKFLVSNIFFSSKIKA